MEKCRCPPISSAGQDQLQSSALQCADLMFLKEKSDKSTFKISIFFNLESSSGTPVCKPEV